MRRLPHSATSCPGARADAHAHHDRGGPAVRNAPQGPPRSFCGRRAACDADRSRRRSRCRPGGLVLKVGLTGGIGAGKSEVSRRLAAQGAVVIDADAIAREVVQPGTPGLAEIVGVFGSGVLMPDGTLDRKRLGDVVFADAELRAKLNAIVHPRVGERLRELEQAAGPGAILVEDVPLIAENELAGFYDLVVVVDVPARVQAERLTRERAL